MTKNEKIEIINRAILKIELCRCYFKYDENCFYYYPNAVNDKFILAQEEDDFLLDGYSIRKLSQLKKVELTQNKYNEINKEIGLTEKIQKPDIDLTSWLSIFNSLKAVNEVVIIENEFNNEFVIGVIQKVLKNKLYFLDFDADGVWSSEPLEIPYSSITSVQWNTRYTTIWKKYLKIR